MLAVGFTVFLNSILPIGKEIPLLMELIVFSLLIGTFVTGMLSKYFFTQ